MSRSIFSPPLGRAVLRLPLSLSLITRFNSTLIPHNSLPEKHKKNSHNLISRVYWEYPQGPKDLLTLLQSLGHALDIPEYVRNKMDLSFTDPLTYTPGRRRPVLKMSKQWDEISLKGITEAFLYHFYYLRRGDRALEDLNALDKVFGVDVVQYLAEKGYCPEDVLVWTWILMARNGEEAGRRIDLWSRVGVKMEVQEGGGKDGGDRDEKHKEKVDTKGISGGVLSWMGSISRIFQPEAEPPNLEDQTYSQTQDITRLQDSSHSPQPITRTYPLGQDSHINTTINHTPSDRPINSTTRSSQIPPFILLFNLRRPTTTLHASTLSTLLPHIQKTLSSPLPSDTQDDKTPLLILIRLLRHARSLWPAAVPMCADLIATHIHPINSPPALSARLTRTYNRILSLFSNPIHSHPFKSNQLNQRSQFIVLRKMAALDIPVTREGYRALINVQLAHPKTSTEALHVSSLSTNWPPWPVPKDGYRHSPGHKSHLSRAAQVLRQMSEAGYEHLGWEHEALVLAGTDTDSSPTIQTRSFYHRTRNSTRKEPLNIWAVRVRATRTLEEAWSIFLDCMNTTTPTPEAWEEMFEKVIFARKERQLRDSRQLKLEKIKAAHDASSSPSGKPTQLIKQALERWDLIQKELDGRRRRVFPGDSKEVSFPPISPRDGIYVGIPPPGVEELFMMMKRVCKRTGKIGKGLIGMLVRESESIEAGEFLLKEWSKMQFKRLVKSAITNEMIEESLEKPRKYKRYEAFMDRSILTQYLHLLLSKSNTFTLPSTDRTDFAIRLLIGQSPRYTPAWNTVISGLTGSLMLYRLTKTERRKRVVDVWRIYKASKAYAVPIDTETLRLLCVAAEKSLSISSLIENTNDEESPTWNSVHWDGVNPVDQVISIFTKTFNLDGTMASPVLLIPETAMLHAYTRVLGFNGRHSEILKMLKWMRSEGVDVTDIMGRRVLVACRVFLSESEEEKEAIEVASGWVSWPGKTEAEEYCIRGWRGGLISSQ